MGRKIIIIAAFLVIAAVFYGYAHFIPANIIKADTIPMDLEVLETQQLVGLNIDADALHFGRIGRGGNGMRIINLSNSGDFPVRIKLGTEGPIGKWLFYEKNNFILNNKSSDEIDLIVFVPEDADAGIYNSTLVVVYRKA